MEGPQKVGKEGRKTGGAESEQFTSYRPSGSALTVEEVRQPSFFDMACFIKLAADFDTSDVSSKKTVKYCILYKLRLRLHLPL